jgi:hypothetical protein
MGRHAESGFMTSSWLYAFLKSVTAPGPERRSETSVDPEIEHPVLEIEAPVVPTFPVMVEVVQVTVPVVGMAFVPRTA